MENQHRKINGYRELTQDEIDCMNKVKELGEQLGDMFQYLAATNAQTGGHQIDMRWLNIGKTHLQQGIMAWVRAVAQPTTF